MRIKDYLTIGWLTFLVLTDMVMNPKRLPERSWRAEFVCRLAKRMVQASVTYGLDWLRSQMEGVKPISPDLRKVIFAADNIGGIPVQRCRPEHIMEPERVLVYFHGGGYVFGSVTVYHDVLARMALEMKALVIGVEYRLGPEYKFPTAQNDCFNALKGVMAQYDPATVTVAGDSAGGALTLATTIALRDNGLPLPAACGVISPWSEPDSCDGSMITNMPHDIFTMEAVHDIGLKGYVTPDIAHDPRVNISEADLTGLPPLYIQTGGAEMFLDQNIRLEKQAKAAGVDVRMDIYTTMFHVFQVFPALVIPEGDAALKELGRFLRDHSVASSEFKRAA